MTAQELFDKLKPILGHDKYKTYDKRGDDIVVIKLSVPNVGGYFCTEVEDVGFGFDWNHGKFIMFPADPIIRKKKE